MPSILKIVISICIICASMSGCMESGEQNADGFRIGETKEFDFIFEHAGSELDMVGTVQWDGTHYIIDCEYESAIDNYMYTAKVEGPANNVRMAVFGPSGLADVSYNNCEGTLILEAMISNAK